MTTDKVEEIDLTIANLIFSGLSIAQMDKIPKWLLENIENNKDTFRTTLTQYHQDLTSEVVEARDKRWKEAIQGLINTSNERASEDWYDGLRACKSITFDSTIIKSK